MKTIKGWIPAGLLVAVMLFGSTVAKAGDGIIFGVADTQQCTQQSASDGIIFGLTDGIIFGVASSTGIIFGYADTGIIFGAANTTGCTSTSRTGIMVSD